jgi:hypothetical protein
MDVDRIYHVSNRPPAGGGAAAFVTAGAAPIAPEQAARLTEIWTYRLDRARVEALVAAAPLELLSISGTHASDLGFLGGATRLRGLAIDWNNRCESIDFLRELTRLEILSLQDMKRVRDLSPIAALTGLEGLQIAGGMDARMEVASLAPLAGLPCLRDLRLANIRILDGDIGVLARLPALTKLSVPNTIAALEQFAALAARLPHVACDRFQPYIRMDGGPMRQDDDPVALLDAIGNGRVMVTGKGGPVLNARADRSRLLRICERFAGARAAAL